ncbi:MAG: GAF domain-containing protein, partial [Ardenticatenaceae bacterium]
IGQLLLKKIPVLQKHALSAAEGSPVRAEERLFDLVNQLNKGRSLIESETEQDQLAELNLLAGQKAKAAAAYEAAFDYLQIGLELLCAADKDEQISSCWLRQYDLALALHEEGAEAAYLSGSFGEMARLAGVVEQQAKTRLDKVKVIEVQLQGYSIQNKLQKALQIGLEGLSLWDMTLPKRLHKLYIVRGLVSSKVALAGKRIEGLIYLPPMSDPNKLAMMRIMSNLGTVAFLTAPELVPLIVFKQIKLSVKYGNTALSPYIYALYGMILCGAVGEIDKGYRFGQLALRVLERFNAEQVKAKTYFIVYSFISHWKEHLRDTLSPLREAYQSGLESGDLEYAAYAAQIYYVHSCWSGKNLAELEGEIASFGDLLLKLKQETSLNYNKLTQQLLLNLLGESENPCRLQGNVYDEEQMRRLHQAANDNNALFGLIFSKFVLCYLFDAYSEAQLHATQVEPYLEGVIGVINVALFYFYDSLTELALYPDLPKSKQKRVLKKVAAHQKKMKKWAKHAPMNHRHRYYLVEAERARVQGKDAEARESYDQAIDLARQNEYVNDEALAHNLAARFYLTKGRRQIAEVYLRHAHSCYGRWGALGKVQQLERRYPDLLAQSKSSQPSPIGLTTAISSTQGGSSALDLISALKASQTMSGEIVLQTLLSKMMTIVIENAGAQRGVLILDKHPHKEGVEWVIQAEGTTNQKEITVLQAIPISRAVLPMSIINLVAHTHEVVVLDDAANEGTFTQDDYIKRHQPKSLLCTPLLNQGKLTGLLYLENNLTTAAFTPDRLEVLSLLSSQAAISLENAQLYNNISALNTAYERFVPRQFLSLLGKESIIDVQLGDQVEKEMTIVFTDIRDFTSISEKMSPTDNFQFVNNYLRRMERVIIEHNGFIDKYMGDGIMALFPTNADDAIRASIAMLRKLHALNLMRRKPIQIGIGVHTGLLMLGTVGGRNRMDGTVISDAVNLGARVEGLTKRYGASLLITQESYTRLQEPTRYAIREIDRVAVKGKSEPVTVLELFDGDSLQQIALKKQTLADFELALTMYRQQEFAFAEKLFRQVLQLNPQDKAAKLYVARSQEYQQRDIPPEWDGVFVATTK